MKSALRFFQRLRVNFPIYHWIWKEYWKIIKKFGRNFHNGLYGSLPGFAVKHLFIPRFVFSQSSFSSWNFKYGKRGNFKFLLWLIQKVLIINIFSASWDFCRLLVTFANSLDPDQAWLHCICPENGICLLHLLHIFISIPDLFYHGSKHYGPRSDCS